MYDQGYSLRKTAVEVGITLTTAFYWRHKIIDAIRNVIGRGNLSGIIETDETFFLESFKGNHKKSKVFMMPRPARKRGEGSKFRGISHEQVCVSCAVDRNGNIINELACKGRITHKNIESVFSGAIDKDAVICTDKHKSYIRFAKKSGIKLIQLKSGKAKKGIYHIQHINSYHNELKKWFKQFNGVSTKHLANYLYWFKWLKIKKDDKEHMKVKELLISSISALKTVKVHDISNRKALFV